MHVCDHRRRHSPQCPEESPRASPYTYRKLPRISPSAAPYELQAASAAILAAAALAIAAAVAARLSLVQRRRQRRRSSPSTAESAPLRVSGGMLFSVMHAAVSFGGYPKGVTLFLA